ncbi:MAG: sulfite exporter TauE/SafE family protein [Propionibacteriaceae bacterium]|jgi:sulfite exporter TauE/SafE/copper chaperone CopZ|nr:sulfite exporter TauE/SafE family protein [Propionibacteriaceae bacterium]
MSTAHKQPLLRVVPIVGMTCGNCEALVGRELRKLSAVQQVKVSARTGTAEMMLRFPVADTAIAAAIERAGYQLGTGEPRTWFTTNPIVWRDVALGIAIVATLLLVFVTTGLYNKIGTLSAAFTGDNLGMVVILGVAASLSSCMALTGGLVMSLSARFSATHPNTSVIGRIRPQLWFNVARIIGFTVLGALLGVVGSLFRFTSELSAVLMIVAALVMGVLGVSLSGISPKLSSASFHLPGKFGEWLSGTATNTTAGYTDWHTIVLGVASFLLPCGFTQAVQVYAASTGSPGRAGLIMGLFALGTAPGLLTVGTLASLAKGKFATHSYRVLGVIVIAFAALNLTSAASTIFNRFEPATLINSNETLTSNVTLSDGVQLVSTKVQNGYSPTISNIYADMPVKWTLSAPYLGCDSWLDLSSLGLGRLMLEPNKPMDVEFTITEPGDIQFGCAMGMYHGYFHVIPQPITPQPGEKSER